MERRGPGDRRLAGRAPATTAVRAATGRGTGPRHRLVLWDIDGTLLTTGPAGREALEEGARHAAGLDEVPQVPMGGKTDPQILKEILAASGLDDASIERVLPEALFEAERVLAAHADRIRTEGRVHRGVPELLASLAATPGVRQSLLTGNIAPNARVKVAAFGLGGYFDLKVGAYGTDHAVRDRLVPIALARALELRGERYRRDEVWIIGDTAHDLSCARAGGVRALIVGTGHEGFDAVRGLDADALVEDLADTDSVLKVLLGP